MTTGETIGRRENLNYHGGPAIRIFTGGIVAVKIPGRTADQTFGGFTLFSNDLSPAILHRFLKVDDVFLRNLSNAYGWFDRKRSSEF